MSKTRQHLAGDARAKAAIEHLLAAQKELDAACRDLCSVRGAAHHYHAIAKLSEATRERVREIDLDYARKPHPYELQHEPSDREIDEPHFACVTRDAPL